MLPGSQQFTRLMINGRDKAELPSYNIPYKAQSITGFPAAHVLSAVCAYKIWSNEGGRLEIPTKISGRAGSVVSGGKGLLSFETRVR
jgi:hypothetical protein